VRFLKTNFWSARRIDAFAELDEQTPPGANASAISACTRAAVSRSLGGWPRSERRCGRCRRRASTGPGTGRRVSRSGMGATVCRRTSLPANGSLLHEEGPVVKQWPVGDLRAVALGLWLSAAHFSIAPAWG
jgi:hypothetical protein